MEPPFLMPGTREEFAQAQQLFKTTMGQMTLVPSKTLTRCESEEQLAPGGRVLLQQLYHVHLWKRERREIRSAEVMDSQGQRRTLVEPRQQRLMTVVGRVQEARLAYRLRKRPYLRYREYLATCPPIITKPLRVPAGTWPKAAWISRGLGGASHAPRRSSCCDPPATEKLLALPPSTEAGLPPPLTLRTTCPSSCCVRANVPRHKGSIE